MDGSRGLVLWAGRVGLARKLAITLGVFAILSGIATLAMLRGLWPGAVSPHLDQLFLLLNLVLLLPLIAIVAWRLVQVVRPSEPAIPRSRQSAIRMRAASKRARFDSASGDD